jgi:hypothetical protein
VIMHPRLLLVTILAALFAAPIYAQQTGVAGATNSASVSPYIQRRSQAYTSFDNPYAPGALYDPYRSSRMLSGSKKQGLQPNSKSAGLTGKLDSGHKSMIGRKSDSDDSVDDKSLSSSNSQCGGQNIGASGMASGSEMNRPTTMNSYSGLSRCGGGAGNSNSPPASASAMNSSNRSNGMGMSRSNGMGMNGLNSPQKMNSPGQSSGLQQQKVQ